MDDDHVPGSPAKPGLTDAELAIHPTVFAADALKDQVVVVSGGAGGIGRAIAWLFARLGAHVAVVGRDREKLDALVAELASRELKASAYTADIREPDAVSALFDSVWTAQGRVDILVNSAGGQFPQAAIDFSIKGWNAVIDTNLNGTWYMMQAAASVGATASTPAASSISWSSPRTASTASRTASRQEPASSDYRAPSRSNGRR
jgi:citronellol/citronellal dehydrogenase